MVNKLDYCRLSLCGVGHLVCLVSFVPGFDQVTYFNMPCQRVDNEMFGNEMADQVIVKTLKPLCIWANIWFEAVACVPGKCFYT